MPHIARLLVSKELLCQSLHLPTGTTIRSVFAMSGENPVTIVVEHEKFNEVPEFQKIPEVTVTYRSIESTYHFFDY